MTISERLDRLPVTRRHRYVVALVGVATFFDLYDLFLAGTISTVLTKQFAVSPGDLKLLLASAFLGAFVGALGLGRLADRVGRRTAFLVTLGLYSVFTLLGAFSTEVWMLVVCRFIAGIGIGAELPLADAYLADLLPAKHRGRATAWAYTIGFCGVPAAGFLARWLAEYENGWRWLFVIGGLGAVVVLALRTGLPESPRWLVSQGRYEEAEAVVRRFEKETPEVITPEAPPSPKAPATALFRPPWLKRTAMLYVFQALQAFGYYGFGSLVPIVLAAKGFHLSTSLTYVALTFLGYPLGSALSIPIIERAQRKWLIIGSAAGMAGFGLAFGYATTSAAIITFGFCYTLLSNVFSNAFHTYQGELFPTELRATAAGSAYSLSRLATAAMPFVLLPVLTGSGPGAMFAIVAGAMMILIVDVALLGPPTTGRSVESIADGSTMRTGATR
ncbi:MFS transporter, putative metabolite:H+ symporter [Amycolatopsis xylanica]|uniref:MFS transporter, putative metabolite:H+ symporter n=1 Tax=Amycolatopsis xylanica TaxID=589385 RepID=A0A1H3QBC1_9PSEU|nr:MFS transporter [Amycolatopsis xylanica]SDZ10315.1 MFS transporter, putative metabolite:H+ symporter [Amycolatopsis xylanica]